ncbi:hypothetical protein RDV89_19715 [Nocardioides zeae]|uniref:Integral membrane protein n=1 Tax=Nocardioides imazamoxiresistens TaxID=3231893 RepID=A0ABU3Q1E2_9ACTN|nr:hypothetical protein [Nocardioides zeae]MDT9595325.1 hypothetical protein [Nocardioides zeae]
MTVPPEPWKDSAGEPGPSPANPSWSWGPGPAGPPQAPSTPWGAPPPQAPQAYPSNPYGVPEVGPSRPGTVIAAAVIAIVCSALAGVLSGLGAFFFGLVALSVIGSDDGGTGMAGAFGVAFGGMALICLAFLAWSVVAIVAAAFALRGSQAGRWILFGSSVLVAGPGLVLAVIGFGSSVDQGVLPLALTVLAGITAVLLVVGGAGPWFAAGGNRNRTGVGVVGGYDSRAY